MKLFDGKSGKAPLPEMPETAREPLALDDEQRVKVLSPGMLVFKRFITNRLAIVGSVCIAIMFLFSFVGGWLMPYGEDEVFKEYVDMIKDYASVTENTDFRYSIAEGKQFPSIAQASFVLAVNRGETSFSARDQQYSLEKLSDDFYIISALQEVASAGSSKDGYLVNLSPDFKAPSGFETAFKKAITDKSDTFTVNGTEYRKDGKRRGYCKNPGKFPIIAKKRPVSYIPRPCLAISGKTAQAKPTLAFNGNSTDDT